MREGWEYKKIKEVCSFIGDGDWIESKDQSDSGMRLIQTGNIGTGIYRDKADKVKYISNATFSKLSCTEIFEGDCLLSRLPDPIGRSCLLPKLNVRTITAVDCTILRFKDDVLPTFFVYYTQSNSYYKDILSKTTGTTRKRISRKNLEKIGIPIPPKPTQLSIVSELDKLNELIQIKKEQLKDYDTLAQSIFYEMFGDPVENEKGWEVKKLGEVSIYPKERVAINQICSSQYVGVENLIKDRGGVRFSDNLPKADVAIAYKENDILLGNIRPYLKKIWLADKVGGASGDVVIIRIKERSISPLFLFKLLSSDQFFEYDNTHTKGAKMPRGDRKAIEKFGVILPPLPLQHSFAQKIEQIEQQKAAIQKTITDLETLLAARMQYWFD